MSAHRFHPLAALCTLASLGASQAAPLCPATGGSLQFERIAQINIAGFSKTYWTPQVYAAETTAVALKQNGNAIKLSSGSQTGGGAEYPLYWRVWVDLDRDGLLSPRELVYSSPQRWAEGSFSLPAGSSAGPSTMRIAMQFGAYPEPCLPIGHGSVVDIPVTLDAAPDRQAPTALTLSPAANAIDVTLSTPLSVTLSEPIDPATLASDTLTLHDGNGPVPGQLEYQPGEQVLRFRPHAPLTLNVSYTATLRPPLADRSGNALAAERQWRFKTVRWLESGTFQALSTSPIANATKVPPISAKVRLSRQIDPASLNADTFQILDGDTPIPVALGFNTEYKELFANFRSPQAGYGRRYTAVLSPTLRDANGVALGRETRWSFDLLPYCPVAVEGSAAQVYFRLGGRSFQPVIQNGRASYDYSAQTVPLSQNAVFGGSTWVPSSYTQKGWTSFKWKAWIDWNQDHQYGDDEQVAGMDASTQFFDQLIAIPANAKRGVTGMRVLFFGPTNPGSGPNPTPCHSLYAPGDVAEFTVDVR